MVNWARALLHSEELRTRLSRTAQREALRRNDQASEGIAYLGLVDSVAREGRPAEGAERVASVEPLAEVDATAKRLRMPGEVCGALEQVRVRVHADDHLSRSVRHVAGELATAPPAVAVAAVQEQGFEDLLGPKEAATLHLALALTQVPAAEARLKARGVPAAIVEATLQDLVDWTRESMQWGGLPGITLEVLEWAQRYLRGELLRIGGLQCDLRPFALPAVVRRHKKTRALAATTTDGRVIDLEHGTVSAGRAEPHHSTDWEIALEPGTPILEMWMPGSLALITAADMVASIRNAQKLFAELSPETIPVGACGESWRLDRELLRVVPPVPGIQDMARFAMLLPSSLSEAKTIRRLFGPHVERADLAGLARENMDPVRRAIADHLANPGTSLRARAGFVLREELDRVPV
jgi:hypothetical protein